MSPRPMTIRGTVVALPRGPGGTLTIEDKKGIRHSLRGRQVAAHEEMPQVGDKGALTLRMLQSGSYWFWTAEAEEKQD